ADTPTRTPAARRTTGNPGAGTPPRGQPPHTHRPIAGTAIRWPRATHRLGSLLATVAKRGEEGSLTSERDGKILARQRQADSNIAKEHSRETGQEGQRIRPSTRLLDSGSVVVMEGRYKGIVQATGKALDAQVTHVWDIADGKIAKFTQYTAPWQFAEATGETPLT